MTLHALVAVPVPLGQAFSYEVPGHLVARVTPGARVLCEFRTRQVLGIVLEVGDGPLDFDPSKLKPIAAVVDSEPVLPLELLAFLRELSSYYLSPIGEVMRLAVPAVERTSVGDSGTLDLLTAAGVSSIGKLIQVAVAAPGVALPAPPKLAKKATEVLTCLLSEGPQAVADSD